MGGRGRRRRAVRRLRRPVAGARPEQQGPGFEEHFTPAVEVGWRLARAHWGNGYATEAGRAALAFGFEELGLEEIVSFTSRLNEPSWRVMQRLGMSHDPADDFEHPRVPAGHPLRPHVLYRLSRPAWAQTGSSPFDGLLDQAQWRRSGRQ